MEEKVETLGGTEGHTADANDNAGCGDTIGGAPGSCHTLGMLPSSMRDGRSHCETHSS